MTTKEAIKLMKKLDPTGEMEFYFGELISLHKITDFAVMEFGQGKKKEKCLVAANADFPN